MSASFEKIMRCPSGFVPVKGGDGGTWYSPRSDRQGGAVGAIQPQEPRAAMFNERRATQDEIRAEMQRAASGRIDNARVVVTEVAPEDVELRTFATVDRYDRAHAVRGPDRQLLSGAAAPNAKPRRYPACYMQGEPGRMVAIDTVYERTSQRRSWLEGEGLMPREPLAGERIGEAMARYEANRGRLGLRGITRFT